MGDRKKDKEPSLVGWGFSDQPELSQEEWDKLMAEDDVDGAQMAGLWTGEIYADFGTTLSEAEKLLTGDANKILVDRLRQAIADGEAATNETDYITAYMTAAALDGDIKQELLCVWQRDKARYYNSLRSGKGPTRICEALYEQYNPKGGDPEFACAVERLWKSEEKLPRAERLFAALELKRKDDGNGSYDLKKSNYSYIKKDGADSKPAQLIRLQRKYKQYKDKKDKVEDQAD